MTSPGAAARYAIGRMRAATRPRPGPTVAIIGAGFGGLATAVRLRQAGIDDLIIIDGQDGVGGTWRRNTYPGAACDIQSHLYSLSFAPNRNWSRTYARQPEILAYLERVTDEFDLRRHLRLNTHVQQARWHDDAGRWTLELRSVDGTALPALTVDVVVCAVGLFGAPKLPEIDGLSGYRGALMHTSRWDSAVDLTGKRVAVIGTGASGVQVVPEIADSAVELTVFQRTPPWMVPKDDRPFAPRELARFRRLPFAARRERWRIWKEQHDNTAVKADDPLVTGRQGIAEAFLERTVTDPALRSALTPDYPFRCKRVLLGADYYRALQQPHVRLVTEPIARVADRAIVTGSGLSVPAEAIVLATGFETSDYLSGMEVVGRGGRTLREHWAGEPSAYLGVAVGGFPNFFMLYGPNTNQGGNSIVYILEAGARLVASAVSLLARRGGTLDVRPEAEQRFNDWLTTELQDTVWTRCDSYFRSSTGRVVTQWPGTELEYMRRTWRLRRRDWIHRAPAPGFTQPGSLPRQPTEPGIRHRS